MYVNNQYNGDKTAPEAYKLTSLRIEILSATGFKLRKFKSNCQKLVEHWQENGYEENIDCWQRE